MTDLNRRTMLRMMTAAPVAALVWTETEAEAAAQAAGAARQTAQRTATPYKPKFFTPHQWATVSMLTDIIIPKDDRSGSATDAGVPEFMDFMMVDQPARQSAMRGGLAWLDRECNKRFDKTFVAATDAQRKEVLDEISWPRRAKPEVRLMSLRWAAGAVLAGVALGWQALYELGVRACRRDSADLLALCSGPLDTWVLPLTLAVALMLVAIGVWRLMPPPRD
jgi:hypothetical protein